jgi:hypothetical protein
MPLGPSAGSVARYTLASAPSATERHPLLRFYRGSFGSNETEAAGHI